jgi:glutathione S-transferase
MTPILVTIPFSHYCEKARWALQRAGVRFAEEPHVPFFSRIAGRRRGVWHSVPVLATPTGTIADSTAILRWADAHAAPGRGLFPDGAEARREVEALEDELDEKLGPHTRRLAYSHVLPNRELLLRMVGESPVPRFEKLATRVSFPVMRAVMRRGMRIDAEGVARSRARIDEVFARIGERLRDGRRFLAADRFTAADLTFAALAAPILVPPQYGSALPPVAELAAEAQDEIARLRATPAGAFALRTYSEFRGGAAS